jgi:acetyl-CoA C-acetyltransferase
MQADEFPRLETTLDSLMRLKPCFVKENGTITAGNASGINDGAAMIQMCSLKEAKQRNLNALCRIVSWAQYGCDPMLMGVAPINCIQNALQKANWALDDVDLFEINEAFGSQSCAILKYLKLDERKVNINGGSIAIGHPIGCSGARILVTLVHSLIRNDKKRGLAALCIGGGMSICMCIEKI